jgi:hypothetical protein
VPVSHPGVDGARDGGHIGGALGVAIMGSVEAAYYGSGLPHAVPATLKSSVTAIGSVPAAANLHGAVAEAFTHGVRSSMGWTAVVLIAVALLACFLPDRKRPSY